MQFKSLRPHFNTASPAHLPSALSLLVGAGLISYDDAAHGYETARANGKCWSDVLRVDYGVPEHDITSAFETAAGALWIDPAKTPPDPVLIAEFGPAAALHRHILPWQRIGGCTIVACSNPANFAQHRAALEATFGDVRFALATETQIAKALYAQFASYLAQQAETRLPTSESCRTWSGISTKTGILWALLATLLLLIAPSATVTALFALTIGTLGGLTLLNAAAVAASLGTRPRTPQGPEFSRLPAITLLVPLYKERKIASHLIERLNALDYPRSLLDVCLILEACDRTTLETLNETNLPAWVRTIRVPDGTLRTKPRALNYALDTARGDIVGVYDAEDAPSRSQLLTVAAAFAKAPPDVGCLQACLDYYNPRANWLTRCFTIEYASWFRVVLPGLARLGFVVPLGGTSIFFRREILDKLGAWDAHNVTEDADLGIRLARRGYRTEFIDSVTEEEANGHAWPWIRQRSRWLKGYAITYAVHARHPRRLLQNLGAWKFFGFHLLFLGTLVQFIFAPLLWTFWITLIFGQQPLSAFLSNELIILGSLVCFFSAGISLTGQLIGIHRAAKLGLIPWLFTLPAYFPLATLAIYKGLWEIMRKPFFWDKTEHGLLMPHDSATRPQPPLRPASSGF